MGLSKKEFIASKFLTVGVFALISTLFLFIVSMILGLSFSDYNEFSIITTDLEYVLGYFVKLMGFFAFCMFLGVFVKRSAFALGFLFIWWIIENIVFALLKFRIFRGTDIAESIVQFFSSGIDVYFDQRTLYPIKFHSICRQPTGRILSERLCRALVSTFDRIDLDHRFCISFLLFAKKKEICSF